MAMTTANIVLPKTVAAAVQTKVKDNSVIAALSPQEGKLFVDENYLVFDGAAEAEVVAEGAAKGDYTQTIKPVIANRATIQTTTRVSKQLQWADEDDQLQIVDAIQNDQSGAMGRALDYLAFHAINPKDGAALSGYTALTAEQSVHKVYLGADIAAAKPKDIVPSIDSMVEAVNDGYEVDGLALSKPYANALRKMHREDSWARIYPDIPLNLQIGNFEGIPAACSGTVNGRLAATPTNVLAIMGNFGLIRWGFVRDIQAEVIEYGDPDGKGDLKRYNQIAFRTEAVLAWAVLDPAAFAVLYNGTAS